MACVTIPRHLYIYAEVFVNMPEVKAEQVLIDFARRHGAIRSKDLAELGIPRTYLQRLTEAGVLDRVARGTYRLVDYPATELATLVEAARRVPHGILCLLSALQVHEIGAQLPDKVWIAIDRKAWKPRVEGIPLRVVRFSGPALTEGVETHRVEGVTLAVYSPAKTVADCFKYRNKIGLEVALEALEHCRRSRKCRNEDLWCYAGIDRVQRVMRPYMEAIG